MTGQTMEPDEDMDNVRYERENVTGGDASDPLDLSTGGSKADSMSSSRPISDVHPRQEMFLAAPRHLDIPHTTTAVTSGYGLSRSHTDISNTIMSRPWPFSPGSPNSIVRPIPHGDHSPPKELARFPQPSSNRTYQPERNGAPMFPGSAMDSSIEDLREMNDIEVVSNGIDNLGPLSGRPLPAAYPDGALMYSPLGHSGMLSLGLPTPYDTAHMSTLSMTAASMLSRKRRVDVRDPKKDKEATTSKSSPSSATVTSAQASSNSPDPNDESEPKKTKTVPEEKKDDAYWERRRKNNEAAKRSRDARRQKEEEIAVRAAWLEQENLKLRAEIAVLKNETAKLHCLLLNRRV